MPYESPAPVDSPDAAIRPLRIAFLGYRSDPRVGGQGVYLSQAARALARRGHRVDILSGPPYPEVPEGVRLIEVPSLDLYNQPHHGHRALRWRHLASWADASEYFGHLAGRFMEPYTFARRAAKLLRARTADYDLVLDNQCIAHGLLAIERAGLPVVGVIHHPIRRDLELALAAEPKWGMRLLVRQWYGFLKMQEHVAPRLRQVITVSEAARADIMACLRIAPERITAIPLGIDRDAFRPDPAVPRRSNRILTTASADAPLKGLVHLIRAFARLAPARPDLELMVIGKLKPEGATAKLLAELGLGERIRFVSGLSLDQMVQAYREATICVSPSLYEGFGLPAAEAMCCAAPVVVTDGGALPEVVGDAGVVVPRADDAALAEAIAALLDDPDRRSALGAAAAARAAEAFDWDRVAQAYEAVFARALSRC